jgi:D-threo-aldose 1-dehydrogenase
MNQGDRLADLARNTDVEVMMLAGRHTLLEQPALDELLPLCTQRGIAVVAAGVFNSGLLARPIPASDAHYDFRAAPEALFTRAWRMAEICPRHDTTRPAAALAFPLGHPAVASACVSARSPEQILRKASRHARGVPAALWRDSVAAGLVRGDAPLPDGAGTLLVGPRMSEE